MTQLVPRPRISTASSEPAAPTAPRPEVRGKYLYVGGQKLYVRGVTYGTFRPDAAGEEFHNYATVERDFAQMAVNGINAVRTYTVPPRWLLDTALRHGLYVMVGIPWEQHIAFLDSRKTAGAIVRRVRDGVRACAGHPAVLCFAIGNEIPASIVRWHGKAKVERFLRRLYITAKREDATGLVTYVNFPSTEYLDLPFLDFVSFNVYLEDEQKLRAYTARLQNLAGERPLIMAEMGLDSRRQGLDAQAASLGWQVGTAFAVGCAGAFVFAWTDEWHRGGQDIEDWDFGLTDRQRRPKPALEAVRRAFAQVPFPSETRWPYVSVVVCSHNGARTLRDCCEGLLDLDYPDYEVIVVNDGSTDSTAAIAQEYNFRVISTPNQGLSAARNTGLHAAKGSIVAYMDDDAYPDPHWLKYLAWTFLTTGYDAAGGPNIPPPHDGTVARCVAQAPGGPLHVLLDDTDAEHIPGCNMAFRREALVAVGGFDPQYRAAGDDVDICWRLQNAGKRVGFNPGAVVWHHRRGSVRAYWRQQVGYGRAEALLEKRWPEKYNAAGHIEWGGRLYGNGLARALGWWKSNIYAGTWGLAPFQRLYRSQPGGLWVLPLMPEWYLVIAGLAGVSLLGILWPPMLLAVPLLLVALLAFVVQAAASAAGARVGMNAPSGRRRTPRLGVRLLILCLHLLQPAARLVGRLGAGLAPWRIRAPLTLSFPRPLSLLAWTDDWQPPEQWLASLERWMLGQGAAVLRGGDYDGWDLEVRAGLLGAGRLRMGLEEHGSGQQLARFRVWPRVWRRAFVAGLLFGALAAAAGLSHAWVVSGVLGSCAVLIALRACYECAIGTATLQRAVSALPEYVDPRTRRQPGSAKEALRHPYRRVLYYPLRRWRGWLLILGVTLLSTFFGLLQPWPVKVLADNVLGGQPLTGTPSEIAGWLPGAGSAGGLLVWVALGGLLIFAANSLLDIVLTLAWVKVGQGMVYELARDLFARVQRGSLLFHARNAVGDSLARVTGDSWSIHSVADTLLFAPGHAIITAGAVLVVMVRMNLGLALLALVVAPFIALTSLMLGGKMRKAGRTRRQIESHIEAHVQRTLSGISVVQAFGQEEREHLRFKQFARSAIGAQQRAAAVNSLHGLITGLLATLGAGAVLWLGAREVMAGRLTLGGLLVFVAYLRVLQAQIKALAGVYTSLQGMRAGVDRVVEALYGEAEVAEARWARVVPSVAGYVEFDRVTFGYERGAEPVLRDVNLKIRPGERVAIVGQTGAGKTTLAGLVPRFFDPWSGRVLLDGHDIRKVQLRSLREQVSLVLQEPFLFPVTIAENIAYGRPDATWEEIRRAAEAANAHRFIEKLPEGYDTVVGERGATLSGGERQRIAIARAILRDAPVLILDEPTSSLDSETEREVMQAIDRLAHGRTTLVIAHRLSTIRGADRIVVLNGGRIVEQGTHEQLLARGGRYAALYAEQVARPAAPARDERSA